MSSSVEMETINRGNKDNNNNNRNLPQDLATNSFNSKNHPRHHRLHSQQNRNNYHNNNNPDNQNNNNNNNNNNHGVEENDENNDDGPGSVVSASSWLHWFYTNIFTVTLAQDDTFETVMRKMIVCACVMASPIFFLIGIYWLVIAVMRVNEATFPALILPALIHLICPFGVLVMYLWMRSTKQHAHLFASVIIFGGIVYAGIMCVCIPHFPSPTILMGLAEASVLTRSEWFSLHMALCVVLYIIASYNVTFVNFGEWTLLTLPNPHRGSAVEKLLLTFLGWFVLMVMTAALYLQYVEYLRLVNKSSSTSQMGWAVASHLKKWDLAAVERTLTKYQSLPHADDVVLNQFTQIVQTIRDFSVYLPRDVIAGMLNSGESIRDSQFKSRQVAVMVIEICNFPALCDSVPSSDLSKLLRMYHDTVTSALTAHEGVVVKLSGPSLVVLWGAPRPCDRRAGQACLAALHVIAAIEDQLVAKFEEEGFALSVRIGITSGKAMVGAVGSRDRAMYTANGAIVNMASALAKLGRRVRRSAVLVSNAAMLEAMQEITVLRFVTREAVDVCTKRAPTPEVVHQIVGITDRRPLINGIPGFTSPQILDKHWMMDQAGGATIKKIAEARGHFERCNYEEACKIYEQLVNDANNNNANWPLPLKRQGVDVEMIHSLAQRCKRFVADPPGPDFTSVVTIAED